MDLNAEFCGQVLKTGWAEKSGSIWKLHPMQTMCRSSRRMNLMSRHLMQFASWLTS